MTKALEINYFDFLRNYPDIIIEDCIDKIDFINIIERLHKEYDGKKPLVEIDQNKLSNIIYEGKTNDDKYNIFKKEIEISIGDNVIISIIHTNKRNLFYFENFNQKRGEFYIGGKFNLFLDFDFYYPDKNEMRNIKRNLLIDKCLR